jgi:hypothetical protein
MRTRGFWRVIAFSLLAGAAGIAFAQGAQKPGLYEMTSQMSWQKSPMPAGMNLPPGVPNPFAPRPTTVQICLTQAQIDKYGTAVPQAQGRGQQSCTMTDIHKTASTMTGTMVCTGQMQGQASVEGSWSGNTSRTKVHFTGTMQAGPGGGMPVEWTMDSTSTYKGTDCGSVKPMTMPETR